MSIARESIGSSSFHSRPTECPACSVPGPFSSPFPTDPFRLYECPACALVFLFPQPGANELESLYGEKYYGEGRKKFVWVIEAGIAALTRLKWRKLQPLLGPGDRLLDVGCGRGTLVKLARASGYEAYGVERPFPQQPSLPFVSYQELTECKFPDCHFQVVVLWHVLEHLPDPPATLREIGRLLRPGGWLSVAVPNFGGAQARASGRHWFHLDLPRHFWHFRKPTLESLLKRQGICVTRCSTLSVEYDWFGALQSWMNRLARDENRLYSLLKGEQAPSLMERVARLLIAAALALPALGSALWDGARGQGGTLTLTAQKATDRGRDSDLSRGWRRQEPVP